MLPPTPQLVQEYFAQRVTAGHNGFTPQAVAYNEWLWQFVCANERMPIEGETPDLIAHTWPVSQPGSPEADLANITIPRSQTPARKRDRRDYQRQLMRRRRAAAPPARH